MKKNNAWNIRCLVNEWFVQAYYIEDCRILNCCIQTINRHYHKVANSNKCQLFSSGLWSSGLIFKTLWPVRSYGQIAANILKQNIQTPNQPPASFGRVPNEALVKIDGS